MYTLPQRKDRPTKREEMKGHSQLVKMPNSPAVYSVTLQNKSQHLSRQREAAQLKGEGEPRSPVQSWPSGSPTSVLLWAREAGLPLTFLNTAGSGRGGPKKGTSSLAVTETWKERKLFLWGPGPTLLTTSRTPKSVHGVQEALGLPREGTF